jgi:hypothetical protein
MKNINLSAGLSGLKRNLNKINLAGNRPCKQLEK